MYPSGKAGMEAGIFGQIVSGVLGGIGGAFSRGAMQKAGQQQFDMANRAANNEFEERQGGSFGERNAFKQRLLGGLGDAFKPSQTNASGVSHSGQRFDVGSLFKNITAGQFGEDLRAADPTALRAKVDNSTSKWESGKSLWGDIFSGFGSAIGGGGLGGLLGGKGKSPTISSDDFAGG